MQTEHSSVYNLNDSIGSVLFEPLSHVCVFISLDRLYDTTIKHDVNVPTNHLHAVNFSSLLDLDHDQLILY